MLLLASSDGFTNGYKVTLLSSTVGDSSGRIENHENDENCDVNNGDSEDTVVDPFVEQL